MPVPSKRKNKGSAAIEFVLVSSFVIVPLILGLFTYGFAVIRAMQAVQMTRDVAHMYALGSDFSKQGVQNLLAQRLTHGLNLVANSGNVTGGTTGYGVVVLSTYQKLDAVQCGGCNNSGHIVVMRRIVVGNKTLYQTGYGAPTPSLIDPNSGNVKNYSADISARAD